MLNAADDALAGRIEAACPGAIETETAAYLEEPRGRWRGQGLVVAPRSTEEVARIVTLCAEARVGIVPYSGGTGLVGGQLMQDGPAPVVLSLRRMSAIRDVWPEENVMVAEGGAILDEVHAAAEGADRLFPLSLASSGSARIGGLLATNAGGTNVLRYGMARAQVLGVEAVLADGTVWHGLTRLRKDNAGYDLRDLLIGSEGTLGIITAAALRLYPRPRSVATAFLTVPSPEAALDLLALAGEVAGEAVSAFELISGQGARFLQEVGPEIRPPMEAMPDWGVLVEVGLHAGAAEVVEELFARAAEAGLATDGVIAQSEGQRADLWAFRETIPEANRRIGSVSSHDISLPLSEVAGFIAAAPAELGKIGDFRINCFGHLGDGNLHYNVFPKPGRSRADHEGDREAVKTCVHDMVNARGGSVAAEHGVGRLKVGDLTRYGDPAKLAMMRAVKAALDPQGILNPGAVLAGTD